MKRINNVKQTSAMALDVLAKGMTGKVYNLAAGDPDVEVCDALRNAYISADLKSSHNYGSSQGNAGLRKKIWKNPEEVIIANGAKQLIYMALAAVTKPGDEVVLIGPCWASYMRICDILGLKYKLVIGEAEGESDSEAAGESVKDGESGIKGTERTKPYCPSIRKITEAVTSETAAILINNPNNPTGTVYDRAYLNGILDIAEANDCFIICDEIYGKLTDGDAFESLRGISSVIAIDGFSKCLNITGWRIGYAIASEEIIKAMTGIQSQMSGPPNSLMQSILSDAWDNLEYTCFEAYRERVDVLCDIEKFRKARPEAGFYFYVPIDDKWKNAEELCRYFMEQYRVAVTPGDDYGVPRTVRVSVASVSAEELREIHDVLKLI